MSFETIAQSANRGISDSRPYLDNTANTILRPKSVNGIVGFLFDVPDRDSININWDITDHYTEKNSFLNDHKAKQPIIITLTGFVGELVFRAPEGAEGAVQELSNRLESVEAYLGDSTPGAVQETQRILQQAQSTISAINQTLDRTQDIIGFFAGETQDETAQQKAFRQLHALGDKVILSVQTPWEFFDDMTIQALSFNQEGTTNDISDISVTLKQIRVSEVTVVDYDQNQLPIREQVQAGAEEDQGIIRGEEQNVSFLFNILQFGSDNE